MTNVEEKKEWMRLIGMDVQGDGEFILVQPYGFPNKESIIIRTTQIVAMRHISQPPLYTVGCRLHCKGGVDIDINVAPEVFKLVYLEALVECEMYMKTTLE